MNQFEKYAKHLANEGETMTQRRIEWSCGCNIDLVDPQNPHPQVEMGVGYVVNPCSKHHRGWDLVA